MSGRQVDRGTSERAHLLGLGRFTIVIVAGLSLTAPGFVSLDNLQSLAAQPREFGLLSLAVPLAMLKGGIDLSAVATAHLALIVAALLLTAPGVPGWSAILAAAGVGTACGTLNGVLVAIWRLPAILATLGTLQLISGLAIVLTWGHAVTGPPDWVSDLGDAAAGGVPVPLLAFAVIAAALAFGLRLTGVGFEILAGVDPHGGTGLVPGLVLVAAALQLLASGLDFLSLNNIGRDLLFGGLLILIMATEGLPGTRFHAIMRLGRWKTG